MGADLIKGPVGRIIGLIVWMAVFSLLLGSINQWYLQAKDAGVVGSERFDRVVLEGGYSTADAAWAAVTGTGTLSGAKVVAAGPRPAPDAATGYLVEDDGSGRCKIGAVAPKGSSPAATDVGFAAAQWYTPSGTQVTTAASAAGVAADDVLVSGCKFSESGSIFNTGGLSGLIAIILQAAGLAPPIALLFILGTFGQSFIRNLGGHPILAAVGVVIMLLLLATLFNTLVPFLATAFEAIDGNRFVMYAEGLGAVSTIVGDFFGVVLVSSVLMVAWTAIQHFRGGDTLSSGRM